LFFRRDVANRHGLWQYINPDVAKELLPELTESHYGVPVLGSYSNVVGESIPAMYFICKDCHIHNSNGIAFKFNEYWREDMGNDDDDKLFVEQWPLIDAI
ncbi:hypothetical protein BDV95DRAFT_501028, partial [Massariosphaeria phaeospora]